MKEVKMKQVKIKAFVYGEIPEDEFTHGYFLGDAIDSIIMKAKPEDWIYEDMEMVVKENEEKRTEVQVG